MKKIRLNTLFLGVFFIAFSVFFQYLPQIIVGHENILLILNIFSVVSSTVGGIVISIAFENDEKFMKKLYPRLSAIIRKSSLNTAMANKITSSDSNDIMLTRIQDIIPHLSSVTTDLMDLTGGDIASEIAELNNNLKDLLKIYSQMSAESQQPIGIQQESRESFNLLVDKISDLSDSLSPVHIKVSEVVKCPYCQHENDILIGQVPPASACPICRECKKRFHANRKHDGTILTKKYGG